MNSDPWRWTVSQVADFFRHDAADLISDSQNIRLPDMNKLVQVLEENEVSGYVLLTAVDTAFLKDDCDIRALGNRSAVMGCIAKLKARSNSLNKAEEPPAPGTPLSITAQPLHGPTPFPSFEGPTHERVRSGEIEVQDEQGRKRRKLNLMPTQPAVETPAAVPSLPAAFFGDSAQPVDTLFYGKTGLGEEIKDFKPDGDVTVDDVDRSDPEMAETNFSFHDQNKLPGEAAYVYSQLRHFMTNDVAQPVQRRGRVAMAFIPYREKLLPQSVSQSAMVFQMKGTFGDDAIVVRENEVYLDPQIDYSDLAQESTGGGEWDFLVNKHRNTAKDKVLPEYGQSNSASTPASLRDEMDEEDEEDEEEDEEKKLRDSLDGIIDRAYEKLAEEWKAKIRPSLEDKQAWTVWKKMKQSRSIRTELLKGAAAQIQNLEARLDKFKQAVKSEVWRNEKQIMEQCDGMQATVEDIEEWKWKMDVWQRKQEPYHVVRRGQHSGAGSKKPTLAHDSHLQISHNDRFSVQPVQMPVGAGDADESFHSAHSAQGEAAGQDEDRDASDEMSVDGENFVVADDDSPGFAAQSPIAQEPSDHSDFQMPSSPPAASPSIKLQKVTPRSDDELNAADESDLPHPSTFLQNKAKPEKTPTKPVSFSNMTELIEISSDSTPANSGKKRGRPAFKNVAYSDNPEKDTMADVMSWHLDDLVKRNDRKRILIKLLCDMGGAKRKSLHEELKKLRRPVFSREILAELRTLQYDLAKVGDGIMELACRLFLAYHFAAPEVMKGKILQDVPWALMVTDKLAASTFVGMLDSFLLRDVLFQAPKSTRNSMPSKLTSTRHAGSIVIDLDSDYDDDDDDIVQGTPKRKVKKVVLNAAAEQSQVAAFQRQERFKMMESQVSNSQKLLAMIQADPSRSTIPINVATKTDDQELIFIDKKIASRMKEHQVNGVRFMWRELVTDDEDGGQGCILAHTMGLGKTMQTIAVLVAINEAAQSSNPQVHSQIPDHLRPKAINKRQLRMLILCPASLVQNWRAEIDKWASHVLSNVFSVEAGMKDRQTLHQLRSWHKVGGVLLIGYDLFRSKIKWKKSKNAKAKEMGPELEEHLLQSPEIVVADEAHRMKDQKSEVSKCASMIDTECRIGLTGTPMSNDVDEIYSLISFAAPNYLGDKCWFNEQFSKPIADGSRADSSNADVRKMLKKLAVLRQRIEPKVNRADITALRGSLKPKVEFVIFMPLTAVQYSTYNKYLTALMSDKSNLESSVSQTRIFGWLWILTLLTNHPMAFKMKLQSQRPPTTKKGIGNAKDQSRNDNPAVSDTESASPGAAGAEVKDDDNAELDKNIRALEFAPEVIQDMIAGIEDDPSPQFSAKMSMLIKIVQLSKQCGDKALVFSSNLATLDYVEQLLQASRIRVGRIQGSVEISARQQVIDDFHADKTDVMLISTRAGGVGLNIQGANRVIILDFGFNPSNEEQAIGRAYRLGQTKPVFVYRLITGGTFEDNIYDKQLFKISLTQRVVDKKNPRRAAQGNAREWLYEPKEIPQEDLRPWFGKDENVLDQILRNQLAAGDNGPVDGPVVRKLTTIETLQEDANDLPLNEEEQKEVQDELALRHMLKGESRKGKGKKGTTSGFSQQAIPPPPTVPGRATKSSIGPRPSQTNAPASAYPNAMVSLKFPSSTHGHPAAAPRPTSTIPKGLPNDRISYPMPNGAIDRPSSSTQGSRQIFHGLPNPR